MPRLFVGNFDFEHGLANAGYQPSLAMLRRNAQLAAGWIAVAEDGDFLFTPQPISADFWEEMAARGFPRVVPVTNLANVPANGELVPWGWTAAGIQAAQKHRWTYSAPEPEIVRDVNSRRWSFALETEWNIGLLGASAVTSLEDVDRAVNDAQQISPQVVIKANWGMSGRERLLIRDPLADAHRAWLHKRLAEQQAVFVEPWMERIDEAGIQIEIPRRGSPVLAGVTALICDAAGQYRGSWCTEPLDAGDDFRARWQPAVDIALAAAERLQRRGYFGPVGIDALRYRLPDGSTGVRPLQDINARWTMGRLSLGWQRFLRPGERAFWQHGGAGNDLPTDIPTMRCIETSPAQINGQPVEHRSRLWIVM